MHCNATEYMRGIVEGRLAHEPSHSSLAAGNIPVFRNNIRSCQHTASPPRVVIKFVCRNDCDQLSFEDRNNLALFALQRA